MADGRLVEWEVLACLQCSGTTFLNRHTLRQKPGSGITAEASGWQCATCGTEARITDMQRHLRLQAQRAQLAALEAELAAAGPPPAPRVAGPSSHS